MIGRWSTPRISETEEDVGPKGFDDFTLRLGDMMRGERATLGKSLLDVQRELRIKASYIAAIENCDPSAFDTPGFIAGYVRSYARYLGMDPDEAFATFCAESGFTTAHGMSAQAAGAKPAVSAAAAAKADAIFAKPARDPLVQPNMPFVPNTESILSQIEPRAVGSLLVLLSLVGAIGFGGWTVLQEIQRVQLTPVDQTPVVLTDLDPLAGAEQAVAEVEAAQSDDPTLAAAIMEPGLTAPSTEALDRLYRPAALDVPVLVARDAPISTLDPATMGSFADSTPRFAAPESPVTDALQTALAEAQGLDAPVLPQVLEPLGPGVTIVAARPAWIRVRAADGSTLFSGILDGGEAFAVPQTEDPATVRVGESGAVYFSVNGVAYGPAGPRGAVTAKLALDVENLTTRYEVADMTGDRDLARVVAELQGVTATD